MGNFYTMEMRNDISSFLVGEGGKSWLLNTYQCTARYNAHKSSLGFSGPGLCGSVDWAPACELKDLQFDSQSGHVPGLQARSPVGTTWEVTTHCCFSPSLSPSLPLCLKINLKKSLRKKFFGVFKMGSRIRGLLIMKDLLLISLLCKFNSQVCANI